MTRWERLTRKVAATSVRTFKVDDYVIYHYNEFQSCKICALFDSIHTDVNVGGELPIDSVEHWILVEKYVLTRKPQEGDLITRRDITYEVVQVLEDGHASYRLRLLEVDGTNGTTHYDII